MKIERVALKSLRASDQPRPLVTEAVDKLAASMGQVGLIQPIMVVPATIVNVVAEAGFRIVAGHHRVAAARALGWAEIDAIVFSAEKGALAAELIEIDENLCRSELTPAQRSAAIKRRKQIWEAMNPAGIEVGQLVPPQSGRGGARPQTAQFAADTAKITGESKRDINRHVARAKAVEEAGESMDSIVGTALDKGTALDALVKMPVEQRKATIQEAKEGKGLRVCKPQRSEPTRADEKPVTIDRRDSQAARGSSEFALHHAKELRHAVGLLSDREFISIMNDAVMVSNAAAMRLLEASAEAA